MTPKVKKSDLDAAFELINNSKKKRHHLGFGKKNKPKISNLCSRDPVTGSNIRPNSGGRLTNTQQLLFQLNRSVLRHDWEAVATCIDFLLNLNGKLLPVIWKAMFLVLFNHQKSSPGVLKDFLQMCVGIRTESEQLKFLTELVTLPMNLSDYDKNRRQVDEEEEFNWDYSTEEEEVVP